jgi:2-keto-4-pentenoate hydratase/2-oxohepta-3-ene-1,7-dioic acid hydratase in catechol pathway
VLDQGSVIDINRVLPQVPPDLRAALLAGIDPGSAARVAVAQAKAADRTQLSDLVVAPLVPSPGKTICLGLNYYDHAAESGREKPVHPWFFLRCDTSLLAHGGAGAAAESIGAPTTRPNWRW